jgi:phosphomannomutase
VKRLMVFDLDGTLAQSKSPISAELAGLLHDLLGVIRVAIISGGNWNQFQTQLLANLPSGHRLTRLYLLPTNGTQFYQYSGQWSQIYAEDLSATERVRIIASLNQVFNDSPDPVKRVWGEPIEDRGSQITLSALGQNAPLDEKERWDPDFAKRRKMTALLEPLLPEFAISMGGTTSIDVTKRGVNKAYGIGKLGDLLHVSVQEMLFVGDAIFPGGNDYPAQEAGVDSILVRDPRETARVIQTVLSCLGDGATQIKSPRKER